MQISDVYVQNANAEWVKKAHADSPSNIKKEAEHKANNSSANSSSVLDKVSISINSEKNNSAEALVKARADALPEIREERINSVKENIQNGYYNTEDFNSELAGKLVE